MRSVSGPSTLTLLGAGLLLAAATALPSRCALASAQATGMIRSVYVAGGLLGDVATLGPVVVFALVVLAALCRRSPVGFQVGWGILALFLGGALLAQNAATEFRFERGVLPGPIDAREGFSHGDFLLAELPLLLGGRYLLTNVVSVGILVAIARFLRRRLVGLTALPLSTVGRFAFMGACASVALLLGARGANAYCASLHNQEAIASPSATMLSGLVASDGYDGSPVAVRRLLGSAGGSPIAIAEGARALGFSPAAGEALPRSVLDSGPGTCARHPLARPLDSEGDDPPMVASARALSKEVFRDLHEPPIVFHVSLESTRADDIHALFPEAPPGLTPFLDEVYEGAPSAAGFRHAHQSGVRTAHALSAVMCGIGALPFNLALGRDLGSLPLRCLPDVLADAGFRARAFYGHEFVFDDMGAFLRFHRMSLHERGDFALSVPRGVWRAVTDEEVYRAAVDDAATTKGAQYNFVLTLSHHTPYPAPEDLPAATATAIDGVCRARDLGGENCDRLKTLRYADDALRHFVDRIGASKMADRSIVVVSGDHTTHQWVPWGHGEHPEGITQIPIFVWLPPALRARVVDPAAFAIAWEHFRELARSRPISNSDVPTLLLALAGETAEVRTLASRDRWHTLGGQATSPFYRSPTGQGVAHGIDAHGNLFDVDSKGATRPTGIAMETLRGPADVRTPGPHNAAELAFLGAFLRGYVTACPPRPADRGRR